MMKLNVWAIPETGKELIFSAKDDWIKKSIELVFSEQHPHLDQIQGALKISRLNDLVTLNGDFIVTIEPECVRCLDSVAQQVHIPMHMDLSPAYQSDQKSEVKALAEELELNANDIDFSFYQGNEIDIEALLQEQLFLAAPQNYYCRPNCLGLCPKCKKNINKSKCSCSQEIPEDSPWAALKQFKGTLKN